MPRPAFLTTPPLPGWTGRSRRARWRRRVLRRLLAGLLAAGAVLSALQVLRPAPPVTAPVLTATRALSPGMPLDEAAVSVRRVPVSALPPGAVRDVGALRGRSLATPMAPGEVLTATRLVPRTGAEGLPRGTAAVRVLLADGGSARLLSAGQRAMVYLEGEANPAAQAVLILAVERPDAVGGSPLDLDPAQGEPGAAVVLALDETARQRVFGASRPEGGAPRALVVAESAVSTS
jgi:pilus assembly protein CpaB